MDPERIKWKRTARLIVILGFLAAGTALYLGCGEDPLPPPRPPNTGTIRITGGAV